MVVKKERGRFSLRFNISDPIQLAAVEFLEAQPPHSKSQYIANAIIYYNTHFADNPEAHKTVQPFLDRTMIEEIVREIMYAEGQDIQKLPTNEADHINTKTEKASTYLKQSQNSEYTTKQEDKQTVDNVTRDIIFNTMAAFRKS